MGDPRVDQLITNPEARVNLVIATTTRPTELQGGIDVSGAVRGLKPSKTLSFYDKLINNPEGGMQSIGSDAPSAFQLAANKGFFNKKAMIREGNGERGKPVALSVLLQHELTETPQMLVIGENGAGIQVGKSEGVIPINNFDLAEILDEELRYRVGLSLPAQADLQEERRVEPVSRVVEKEVEPPQKVAPKRVLE